MIPVQIMFFPVAVVGAGHIEKSKVWSRTKPQRSSNQISSHCCRGSRFHSHEQEVAGNPNFSGFSRLKMRSGHQLGARRYLNFGRSIFFSCFPGSWKVNKVPAPRLFRRSFQPITPRLISSRHCCRSSRKPIRILKSSLSTTDRPTAQRSASRPWPRSIPAFNWSVRPTPASRRRATGESRNLRGSSSRRWMPIVMKRQNAGNVHFRGDFGKPRAQVREVLEKQIRSEFRNYSSEYRIHTGVRIIVFKRSCIGRPSDLQICHLGVSTWLPLRYAAASGWAPATGKDKTNEQAMSRLITAVYRRWRIEITRPGATSVFP